MPNRLQNGLGSIAMRSYVIVPEGISGAMSPVDRWIVFGISPGYSGRQLLVAALEELGLPSHDASELGWHPWHRWK